MQIMKTLNEWDTQLFLFLNGHHNTFFDFVMYWASNKWIWIPFYFLLLMIIVRLYKKRSWIVCVFIGALITISDQVSSGVIKPLVARLRPSHNPDLLELIHLSKAGPGGMYGFVSGHATNCFALFIFLSLILNAKLKWPKYVLLIWALLVSYSRVYVGVHYPGDVLGGAILGSLIGYLMAKSYFYVEHKTKVRWAVFPAQKHF